MAVEFLRICFQISLMGDEVKIMEQKLTIVYQHQLNLKWIVVPQVFIQYFTPVCDYTRQNKQIRLLSKITAQNLYKVVFIKNSSSLSKKYHGQLRNQTRCCGSNCYSCYQFCNFWVSKNMQSRVAAIASTLVYTRQIYHQYLHRELRFHQGFQYGDCRWSGDIFFSIIKNIALIADTLKATLFSILNWYDAFCPDKSSVSFSSRR